MLFTVELTVRANAQGKPMVGTTTLTTTLTFSLWDIASLTQAPFFMFQTHDKLFLSQGVIN